MLPNNYFFVHYFRDEAHMTSTLEWQVVGEGGRQTGDVIGLRGRELQVFWTSNRYFLLLKKIGFAGVLKIEQFSWTSYVCHPLL